MNYEPKQSYYEDFLTHMEAFPTKTKCLTVYTLPRRNQLFLNCKIESEHKTMNPFGNIIPMTMNGELEKGKISSKPKIWTT